MLAFVFTALISTPGTDLVTGKDWLSSPPEGWHKEGGLFVSLCLLFLFAHEESIAVRIRSALPLSRGAGEPGLPLISYWEGGGSRGEKVGGKHLTWALTASALGSVGNCCSIGTGIQDQKLLGLDGQALCSRGV